MARANNPKIKKANQEVEFTLEQVQELQRCTADPIYFIRNYVTVQHPTRGAVPFDLYPYQEKMIRMYTENRYSVVLSARQTGKEQPHTAKIATPFGWTTMGDIQPGDVVLTPDGKKSNVLIKHPQGIKQVYRITFDDGSTAECGLDHLWTVYIRNKWVNNKYQVQKQTLSLKDLIEYHEKISKWKTKNNYAIRVPVVEKVDFNEAQLPLDPYVLGALLGDGSLSIPHSLLLTSADSEIIERVQSNISHLGNVSLVENSNGYDYRITNKNNKNSIHKIIKDLELSGTKSHTKFIPKQYLESSHNQRLNLLQGLMDTDGTVHVRKNACTISYTTTSKQLRDDFQQLVWSLGGKCSYVERKQQNPKHKLAYDLFVSLPNPKECFSISRKKDLCHDKWGGGSRVETDIRRTIVNIEKVRNEESSCITIDHPDQLYITDNYTVTHNSVTSAAFLLWYAMFHFDKTILIASNKNSNAMEMILRIRFAYENIPNWLKPGVQEDGWNKHNIGFDNGSRIVSTATSEDSGRGMSISLLFLDEFAFVKPSVQDEFWTSIAPTLSTGGSCIMTSTPNGDMDIFAQIWRGAQVGSNGFAHIHVGWDEPPGRGEKFKEEEIGRIGERRWMQEYECEFLSSEALLISSLWLANQTPIIEKVKPKRVIKDVIFWDDVKHNGTYLIGVDPATGSGEDFSVISVFDFPSLVQIAEYRSNTMSTNDLYGILKNILNYFETKEATVYFSVENNGVGEGVIALYEADEDPPMTVEFVSEEGKNRRGMTTTSRTKMRACVNLKEMLEKNNLTIKSSILLAELKSYARKRGAYAALPGSTDDAVSALLIVIRLIEEIASYDQKAYDKLYSTEYDEWSQSDYDGYGDYDENDEGMPILL